MPQATDEIRYGIIGSGMMGVEHIANIEALPGARVTAIADPHDGSHDLVRMFAPETADGYEYFHDHQSLVDSGLCDAVVVASPNFTHVDILLDILGSDLHILTEKPMCTTVADCHRVADAATDHEKLLWVGLEYRYMPPVTRLIDEVKAGAVGDVKMVAIREHRFPFLRKIGDWNRFSRNTGGTLVEKCCHYFDLMNLLVGTRPVRVMASGAQDVNHLDESYDGEVPDILDNAFVIVEYEDGVRGMLDLCMFAEGSVNQEELSVVGHLGKVESLLPASEVRVGRREGGRNGVERHIVHDAGIAYQGFHHGSSYLEHLDFCDAIRTGREPTVGIDDGLWSVAVGEAAHRSIDERRPVDLAEVM